MPHFLILSLLLMFISTFTQPIWGYESSYYASDSRLSQGRWVKVAVDTTGIHQISYETLRQWGFDDPSKVTIHGYGAVQGANNTFGNYPDDLPMQFVRHTADGRILFFAEGSVSVTGVNTGVPKVTRNYYSDKSYYFLTDSYPMGAVEPIDYVSNPNSILKEALFVDFKEKEHTNYGEGGAIFHGPAITAENPDSYDFRVRNLSSGDVSVRLQGILRIFYTTHIKPQFEGQTGKVNFSSLGLQPINSESKLWLPFNASGSLSPTDEEPLQDASMTFSLPLPANFRGTLLAVDHVTYTYRRALRMEADVPQLFSQIPLQPVHNQNATYSNTTDGFEVWDVSTPWEVRPFEGHRNDDCVTITLPYRPNTPTRLVAFDSTHAFDEPVYVEEVANQNLHSADVPQMVILTTPLFRNAADDLASINRARGMDVLVVMQSDIYNEFGSGAPSAAAIRRFYKMLYDRDTHKDKFRFITIYGASKWDPRHKTRQWPDYPLAYLAEEVAHVQENAANFANDVYFGILSDASTTEAIVRLKANVTVGRIPARTQTDAADYNNKVRAHLAAKPSPAAFLRAITTSCDGDQYSHFDHNTALTDTLLMNNPCIVARRADELLFPQRKTGKEWDATRTIADAFEQGVGFFAYCGHGNPQSFGNQVWDLQANKIYKNERYPLAMLATCYVIPIDRMSGIGDMMLFKNNGGVIGSIGACRSVYLDRNKTLSYAVAKAYAQAKPGTTMGEVFTIARDILVNKGMSGQLGANTLCYNYIGDPSMPMSIPEGKIVVETIFGQPMTGKEVVAPGIICPITGYVANPDGSVMADFNGEMTLDMYRAPKSVATRMQQNIQKNPLLEDAILSSFRTNIVNGRFSLEIILPISEAPETPARSILTAIDSSTGKPVAGVMAGPGISTNFILDSRAPEAPAFVSISSAVENHDGTIPSNFDLQVEFSAPAGMNEGHTNFLSGISLRLDGKRIDFDAAIVPDVDGFYSFSLPMTVDRPGAHTITASVTDRFGRSASSAFEFIVADYPMAATLTVDAPEGFVRTEAVFDAEAEKGAPAGRLIITDSSGNTVLTATNATFPYRWDLRDTDGQPAPDGLYRATLQSTSHSAPQISFTIIRQ